jgi:concentrative nucleoside transporter, CNT family
MCLPVRGFAVFLPLLLCIFLFSCSSNQPDPLEKKLAREWNYVSVKGSDGGIVKKVSEGDALKLSVQNNTQTFEYHLSSENIHAKGTWYVNDSSLILSYHWPNRKSAVDSLGFVIDENRPSVLLFHEGKPMAKLDESGLNLPKRERSFKIRELSSTRLVFEEKGVIFTYSYVPEVMEGQVTFTSVGKGMLGLFVMVLIMYLFSVNRRMINWRLVITGLALQLVIAIGVLKVDVIKNVFELFGNFFVVVLSFTLEGSRFVLGDLVNPGGGVGFVFAFQILPTIIFFSALTSLLFYLGILQKIVYALAWIMSKTMKLSGAESLAAAANIFLGQTEAPLLVKPYIAGMTRSELLCLMTGGMATIAGGVMAAFIGFLGGDDPAMRLFFAKHLLAASVMSAPAAIVAAKILMPQTQKIEEKLIISQEKIGKNLLEAISIGTGEGLRLAVNVGAMLLVFIALIAMVNFILKDFLGSVTGLNEQIIQFTGGRYNGLTMQFVLGYLCAPLSWLMGVCKEDMVLVGQLLGEKTILNEFVAYTTLGNMKFAEMFKEQKSVIIATYILCGFANFASIGIQIGGIGSLAPEKRTALSELGFRALLGGTMASLLTAVIVGMLI